MSSPRGSHRGRELHGATGMPPTAPTAARALQPPGLRASRTIPVRKPRGIPRSTPSRLLRFRRTSTPRVVVLHRGSAPPKPPLRTLRPVAMARALQSQMPGSTRSRSMIPDQETKWPAVSSAETNTTRHSRSSCPTTPGIHSTASSAPSKFSLQNAAIADAGSSATESRPTDRCTAVHTARESPASKRFATGSEQRTAASARARGPARPHAHPSLASAGAIRHI